MLEHKILVTDDRRTSVPLLRLHAFRTTLNERDRRARVLADRLLWFMVLRAKRLSPSRLVFEFLLGISILVAFVGPFLTFGFIGPWALLGVLVATPAAVNYFTRETGERKYRRELAASYVAEGICASCGYSLKGLPDESDGCVTCPECGAAWRAQRIVAPTWEDDAPTLPRGPVAPMRWLRWQESGATRTAGDAQGRLVPITDVRLSLWSADRRAALGAERVASLRRRLWRMGLTWRTMVLIAALIPFSAALTFAVMWIRGTMRPGALELAAMILAALIGATLLLIGLLGNRFVSLKRLARELTREHLCPTCGTPLADARTLDDSLVVCAGCAATWRRT